MQALVLTYGLEAPPMTRSRKILVSLAIVGGTSAVAGVGTFAAFSSTTGNAGNTITAGTVAISDNDAAGTMYSLTNQKPGDTVAKCIQVTYTGSLDSSVKLYTPSAIGALGPYVNLVVESGTGGGAFPSCVGFVSETTHFTGTLTAFGGSHTNFSNGITDNPGATTKWVTSDAVTYRITATLANNNSAQGLSTGAHEFRWEAQNQ